MKIKIYKTKIQCNKSILGESIEDKMRRNTQTGVIVQAVEPIIYTDKKEGVRAEFDIRTDKWAVAQAAMGKVNKSRIAKINEVAQKTETENKSE